ncbi:MAG: glycosyltransferase family 9 protein [Fidelibacterota bacterium]
MVTWDRILVIRFSSIGDIILTTPVLENLGRIHPDSDIHYLTLEGFSGILEGNPHVSRIIRLDKGADVARLRHLSRRLRETGYTVFIDCHNSLRSRILRRFLKGQTWFIYRKPRLDRFLLFNLHLNRFPDDFDIPSEYIRLLDPGEGKMPEARPKVYISDAEKRRCQRRLEELGVGDPFIALIPGASWETKVWTTPGYVETANALIGEEGISVVVLGGGKDAVCDEISRAVPAAVNLKGKTSLRESLAVLSCARAAVGGDTGFTHGAEAVGTPVVMLVGPTGPETGARVRHPRSETISSRPWCQPCSKDGSRPCYREERVCMGDIHPDEVLSSLKRVMARA